MDDPGTRFDFKPSSYLRLSVQRALIGNVTSNLACLSAVFEGGLVRIDAYFFQNATDEDREYIEEAATEIIADFPFIENTRLETNYRLASDAPRKGITWNFLRAEMNRRD